MPKNIINIIAGVNGSGKTTILEWIYNYLGGHIHIMRNSGVTIINNTLDLKSGNLIINNNENLNSEVYNKFSAKVVDNKFKNEKVIFFDSNTITKEIIKGKHHINPTKPVLI